MSFPNIHRGPMYDPEAVQPMRDELTAVGFEDLRTGEEVDRVFAESQGTLLLFINSVCGCAAGSARPGLAFALQHKVIPDRLVTVFAGMEYDAVDRAREKHVGYPPSSPSLALFKEGKLVHMVERRSIEGKMPDQIASELQRVFDRYCTRKGPSISAEEFAKLEHVQMCGSSIPRM